MSYQKIKTIFTKHRSASLPVKFIAIIEKVVAWVVPKHNETTLYVLSISFLITFWISSEFRLVLSDWSKSNPEGDSVIFLVMLFFIGAVLAIASVFLSKKVPGFRSFFAPAFIVMGSILLSLEYIRIQLESDTSVGIYLAIYHGLSAYLLLLVWRESKMISKNISKDYKTSKIEILTATILTVGVFGTLYGFTDWPNVSWAVPITTALFMWQFLNIKGPKVIQM